MSGWNTKLNYKQLQTLEHALMAYKKRDDVTDDDLKSEEALLEKIKEQIEMMEERYRIK